MALDRSEERQRLLEETFQEAERSGLKLALKGRLVAIVLIGLWFVLTRYGIDFERAMAFAAACAGYALIGLLHYRLIGTTWDRPWTKYAFITVDIAALSLLLATQPMFPSADLPQVMTFRNAVFPLYFVFLGVAAFSFSPGLLLWTGAAGSTGYLAAFLWAIRDMDLRIDWGDINPEPSAEEVIATVLNPNFIATGSRMQESVAYIVVALLLAVVMWRARLTVRRQLELDEERRSLGEVFGRYVPKAIADALISDRGLLEPVDGTATVLFIDIAGFTHLTESTGPRRTVNVLNAYFDRATEAITARNGVVTQFIGDGIMATFNLPVEDDRHAGNAVLAALDVLALCEAERFEGECLQIRAGISTGPVIGGSVGGGGRQSYSIYGDTVNLAARLEALNKEHGTRLLIAEPTIGALDGAAFREIGDVEVRGFSEPVAIYTATNETRAVLDDRVATLRVGTG